MKTKVLFIGSIGVVAETSELQRQAYNQALKENGVDWNWNKGVYKRLLQRSGGQDRLDMLAMATGHRLSAGQIEKIHSRKTQLACDLVRSKVTGPRAGVAQLIKEAIDDNIQVAWVTTTGKENTGAILDACKASISANDFSHIFHREDAANGKPEPDIYTVALKHFDARPEECIAIEDSLNSILSSKAAGIYTVATLGQYHDEHVENIADLVVDSLDDMNWNKLKTAHRSATYAKVA
ncbi:HAD-IA family hydrolase [Maribacter sp. 2-571]|uniref:HAD-IA family hydrolase n=1 Tax=Maribacter sp. 2-571 TaxID=3417569 RepID=UPI003D32658D